MEYRKYITTRTGQNTFENKYFDVCRNCGGEGMIRLIVEVGGASTVCQCPVCKGTGDVQITKKIEVIVSPIN
ncbi:MAG: hypothetical protein V1775_18245 [Bacteroidota bacterium]